MKIVVKVGSAVLVDQRDSKINKEILLNIVDQIRKLERRGHSVVIVTSGAVASCGNKKYSRALKAIIGQPRLMSLYIDFFESYKIEVGQLLFTHEDLEGERCGYTQELLNEIMESGVVPIINANDAVSSEELDALKQYADNDVLAERVASMIGADIVFLLTNENGLMDFKNGKVVRLVEDWKGFYKARFLVENCKSSVGRGGMMSKIKVAENLCMTHGIEVRLLPGRHDDAILDSLSGKKIGTIFKAKKRP